MSSKYSRVRRNGEISIYGTRGRRQMLTLEIPYAPETAKTWHLNGLAGGRKKFDSRVDAVAFAMTSAQSLANSKRTVCICIEGADGTWRKFNAKLLPIH